jgi:spore germination protein KC
LGVDAAEDGQLEVTYRIAIPRTLGGDASATRDAGKSSMLITITAPTLAEARNLLKSSIARIPNLSHVTGLVVGEDLARKGVADALAPLQRFREFRGATYISVVRGKAKDFMKHSKIEEAIASRWIETLFFTSDESGYYLKATVHEFYTRLKNSSGAPYAVFHEINPLTGEGQPRGSLIPGDKTRDYLPADVPIEGDSNPGIIIGTAVFKEDKLIGILPSEQTRMLAILLGQFPRGFMVVEDPLTLKHAINTNMRLGRSPKIKVNIVDGQAVIDINVFLEGEITSIPSGIFYESSEYGSLLEQQISQVVRGGILKMLSRTQEWGADVVDFGYYLRPKYATDAEFQNLNWDAMYRTAEIRVEVTTQLRRTGLMRKTSPIRREEM